MKKVLFSIFISLLFCGCFNNDIVTKEDCQRQGMFLKKDKVLNYRTGEYEERFICAKKR